MLFKSIDSLEENSKEIFLKVVSILIILAENVINYPKEQKYRKIRLENQTISKFILPSIGGMECLFDMGFQEGGDSLILPNNVNIDKLKKFRQELIMKRDQVSKKNSEYNVAVPSSSSSNHNINKESIGVNKITVPYLGNSQEKFLMEMESRSDIVCQYEDEELQLKALSLVPISRIESRVSEQMREIQKSAIKEGSNDFCEASANEILFLKELMKWFKMEFFKWVDAPPCSLCKNVTEFQGHSTDVKELRNTSRVEGQMKTIFWNLF